MMAFRVVIAGRGGEGILFVTRVLAEGAFRQGHPVISTETHGMAQRGGSVISQVKIGDFLSPMIRYGEADLLIATSEEEVARNLIYLRDGGKVIRDSRAGGPYDIDARGIAYELDHPRGANLVLLGFAIGELEGLKPGPFEEVITELSPSRWTQKNLEAFRRGLLHRGPKG